MSGTVAAAVSMGGLVASATVDGTERVPVDGADRESVDSADHVREGRADHEPVGRAAGREPLSDEVPAVPFADRPMSSPHRSGGYVEPVAKPARVSAKWGIPGDWMAGHHTGVDLAVRSGTTLRSVGPGKVVLAGTAGAYGNAVTVRMKDGKYTLFAHLSKISVRVGQWVRARTVIGESGNSGHSTGPHLHFEVRVQRGYGSDIDPVTYLARRGARIL